MVHADAAMHGAAPPPPPPPPPPPTERNALDPSSESNTSAHPNDGWCAVVVGVEVAVVVAEVGSVAVVGAASDPARRKRFGLCIERGSKPHAQ